MQAGLKVLFVDDEQNILETFPLLLEDFGYYIRTASRPEAAIRLVSEEKFHVVFIDQFLGGESGLELMDKMSGADPDLYFVIMTANASTELAVKALKKGASDFICKPFFSADLIKSIEYVGMKRKLDEQKRNMLRELEFKVGQKTRELEGIYFSVLSTLAQAMEKKDIGTYGHSRRVSYYSRLIAAAMDLDETRRGELKAAALLHDIGKIGISDFILGKKGPLSDDERTAVTSHPQNGVEILAPLKQFEPILPAILHHHENYDGSGYPGGLSGADIPLLARVIAVADTYDAILSNRPYRSAESHECAVSEIKRFAGIQFDPEIVEVFVEASAKYSRLFSAPPRNVLPV